MPQNCNLEHVRVSKVKHVNWRRCVARRCVKVRHRLYVALSFHYPFMRRLAYYQSPEQPRPSECAANAHSVIHAREVVTRSDESAEWGSRQSRWRTASLVTDPCRFWLVTISLFPLAVRRRCQFNDSPRISLIIRCRLRYQRAREFKAFRWHNIFWQTSRAICILEFKKSVLPAIYRINMILLVKWEVCWTHGTTHYRVWWTRRAIVPAGDTRCRI